MRAESKYVTFGSRTASGIEQAGDLAVNAARFRRHVRASGGAKMLGWVAGVEVTIESVSPQ